MKVLSNKRFYPSECSDYDGNFLEPLGFKPTGTIEAADVVIFGGGADVDPSKYGEEFASSTHVSLHKERREREDFATAMKLGKKCFGICRGHQLLCTLAGGKLIQHVNNHSGIHPISTFDGNQVSVNSIHHQMINPYVIKDSNAYKILAWTTKRRSTTYLGGGDKPILLPFEFKEIEAIYFPRINSLGVQYHPEMMYNRSDKANAAVDWTQQLFMKFYENKL